MEGACSDDPEVCGCVRLDSDVESSSSTRSPDCTRDASTFACALCSRQNRRWASGVSTSEEGARESRWGDFGGAIFSRAVSMEKVKVVRPMLVEGDAKE